MSISSWRKLADGSVGVLMVLVSPSGECDVAEILARGETLADVIKNLRKEGLTGIRRPEPGARPADDEASLALLQTEPFIWRDFERGGDWRPAADLI